MAFVAARVDRERFEFDFGFSAAGFGARQRLGCAFRCGGSPTRWLRGEADAWRCEAKPDSQGRDWQGRRSNGTERSRHEGSHPHSSNTEQSTPFVSKRRRIRASGVEALRRNLLAAPVPELDLEVDVVAVALEGVEGDEGEAAVGDDFLVDGLQLELGPGRDGAGEEWAAPDQGDRAGAAVLASPTADHLVVEVDL